MKATRRMTLVGLFSGLFGRWIADASAAAVPLGRVEREEGFVDIELPLAEATSGATGASIIIARATIDGVVVGFRVDLGGKWTATPISEGGAESFHWGKAAVRSIGAESDRFVALLAKLYGLPAPGKPMRERIEVQVVGLASDPAAVMTEPANMKLFFTNDEGDEAEVYLNVDVAARVVAFNEKDPEYRENLVRAMTQWT